MNNIGILLAGVVESNALNGALEPPEAENKSVASMDILCAMLHPLEKPLINIFDLLILTVSSTSWTSIFRADGLQQVTADEAAEIFLLTTLIQVIIAPGKRGRKDCDEIFVLPQFFPANRCIIIIGITGGTVTHEYNRIAGRRWWSGGY
jgi:hypothetical protein